MRTFISIIIFILFTVINAFAKKDIYDMSINELMNIEIKVSDSKETTLFSSPSTVSIITKEDIKNYNYLSVPEALQSVAGLDVQNTIIDKNVVHSRGVLQNFYANKILLMINNIPTWQPTYGAGYLERIDVQSIERIEILKGPASVLYGSNALVAVINIILKDDSENLSINGSMANNSSSNVSVNLSKNIGDFNLFVALNNLRLRPENISLENRTGENLDDKTSFNFSNNFNQRNITSALSYGNHKLMFNGFSSEYQYMGASHSYQSGGNKLVLNQGGLISYNYTNQLTDKLNLNLNAHYESFVRDFSLSADNTTAINIQSNRSELRTILSYDLNSYFDFDIGGDFSNNISDSFKGYNTIDGEVIGNNLPDSSKYYNFSAFSSIKFHSKYIESNLGARYTNNELFGNDISQRFSSMLSLNEDNKIKFIYGNAFRTPTLFELYFVHPTVLGNTNLNPEKNTSLELSYLHKNKWFYFQVLAYYQEIKNLISRFNPEDGSTPFYQNLDNLIAHGLEAEFIFNSSYLNGFLNYTYINSNSDSDELNNYKYVQNHKINLGLNKKIRRFLISGNMNWWSFTNGHLARINEQMDLNLSCSYEIPDENISFSIIGKNLLGNRRWIPEYIRKYDNINAIPSYDYFQTIFLSFNYTIN